MTHDQHMYGQPYNLNISTLKIFINFKNKETREKNDECACLCSLRVIGIKITKENYSSKRTVEFG